MPQIEMPDEETRRLVSDAIGTAARVYDKEYRRIREGDLPTDLKETLCALLTERINKTYALFSVIGEEE